MAKEITPRAVDYSQWYNDIVRKAGLAENSAVRGCMVIKPYGFAIWEKMQAQLDLMFKATGHTNAYFPLFIPKSFLSKEADHVEGFAKECAVVTHYRLKQSDSGTGLIVDPDAKLEEELIIRPTSETIIWNTYRDWIQSYRDLPILINQWANVVRWEMRTRLFLRTAEFLWQEGHTAHATEAEAVAEAIQMQGIYADFAQQYMAMPVLKGVKTPQERFAGALETYSIEALMQDGKALQAGTSHFLGQNFAKAFDVKFLNEQNEETYVWATSWGVSTRLLGGLIMTHSDDKGLVLPPKLAPLQVIIVPIPKPEPAIMEVAAQIKDQLQAIGISAKIDLDDKNRPGFKFAEHEMRGVPVRVGLGARDIANRQMEVVRRDTGEKMSYGLDDSVSRFADLLDDIQHNLLLRAQDYRQRMTSEVNSWEEFADTIESEGGLLMAHWDGTTETELKIKELTKATIRCIPQDAIDVPGACVLTGRPSARRVIFARAY